MTSLWQRWIDRRIPPADRQQLNQRTIFILPTGAGLIFGLLLLIMLVTGINYQNSLIYLLTFFLGALFVAAMHQTHRNLTGLELVLVRAGEGFAGELVPFVLRLGSEQGQAISIELSGAFAPPGPQSIEVGDARDVTLLTETTRRGPVSMGRVRICTRFPFGLLEAWSWMRPRTLGLVYPRPLEPVQSPLTDIEGDRQARSIVGAGFDEADIRPWREGDLSQRVLWKRFARTGTLVIADWSGEQGSPQWLDYAAYPGVDVETRLSFLCHQVLEREQAHQLYGLRLPGLTIEPGQGEAHSRQCLRALARFGLAPGPSGADRIPPGQTGGMH